MGFDRNDAENALMISRNDYEMACEYLLNSESRMEARNLYSEERREPGELIMGADGNSSS